MARSPFAIVLGLFMLVTLAAFTLARFEPAGREHEPGGRPAEPPFDYFYAQRAFGLGGIPDGAYPAAREQLLLARNAHLGVSAATSAWTEVGPSNIGGRVTALAAAPGGATMWLGSADGGVWRSIDDGLNWQCMTDRENFSSIGAVTLDPFDANTIYVGTGEANGSVDSYDGNGVWRSRDGGTTWNPLGLANTGRISSIAVDPGNTNHILVGAMGRQFSTGPDRGLYRSLDGGTTWTKVLFVSDSTGVTDIAINPVHPDTMFCATWERVRRDTYRRAFGPECGIWRSVDRGATWSRLVTGLPLPDDNLGRIALAVAPSRPSTVYAQIGSGANGGYAGLGYYRSTDGGTTWSKRDASSLFTNGFGGFVWYFGRTAVDPANPDDVWALGVNLMHSTDGGVTWSDATGAAHVDQHAIWIDPANPLHVAIGNDGGAWVAPDAVNWQHSLYLPITQFYAGDVDPTNAKRVFGGAQDNNTLMTSAAPDAWSAILGGDGFVPLVDPVTPSVVFSEYQFCSSGSGFKRSVTGGPSPANTSGWVSSDRYNWCTPIAINPRNHNTLVAGSQFLYRSTNNGRNWSKPGAVDLSGGPASLLVYGTITTLAISSPDTNVYYAGTDNGHVQVSLNRGATWTDVSAGLPVRWVTRVTADPVDPQVVYVTLSGFSSDLSSALVYRSANRGASWTSIAGNLPPVPANDLVVDPANPQTLYLGTDLGVWMTRNLGATWFEPGTGMPAQPVVDLTLHAATRQLFAFTHGRSAWKLDLNTLPVSVGAGPSAAAFEMAPVWPNPARGAVRIDLSISRAQRVEVAVFDVVGRRISILHEGPLAAGAHAFTWDARDAAGRRATAGVYFARARAGSDVRVRRVVIAD